MVKRRADHATPVQPVRLAAAIFAPRHLVCVLIGVLAADPMLDTVFGAAQAAEETLGLGAKVTYMMTKRLSLMAWNEDRSRVG
jgi:hypothetical protein